MNPGEFGHRRDLARRLIHQNGVTHNVYGDPNGLDRPWNLDFIPLLIAGAHWESIGEGLIQRARLLDRLLADLYGPADTVFSGVLPPELLWANPGFLRPCHGIRQPQGRWLHLYSADLVRNETGQFEVLSDRTQAPSGAGYTLENRIVLSQALPSLFRQCNVQRLAPFFVSLRETLADLAPANHENPRIVLYTPGPYNETYFEHSFLARYLGYALVQGNDLTVRDTIVYMKTLGGLQRVDVILRRVDDNFCDPLELYPDSYLGVPGLLQAVRRGNVAVANAIGCGVLQAPGILPFLPAVCRYLLGEELKLPSVETWWCGHPEILEFVAQHLSEMVVKSAYPTQGEDPVFGQNLTRDELSALEQKIRARPTHYAAQKQVMSCTTPALIGEEVQPRRFVVRSYLSAYGNSYTVMNGGLSRITQSNDTLVVSLQKGGRSKDTWILSDRPVSPVTLLPSMTQPIAISRGGSDCRAAWRRTFTGWDGIPSAPTRRPAWRGERLHACSIKPALIPLTPFRSWPQRAGASRFAQAAPNSNMNSSRRLSGWQMARGCGAASPIFTVWPEFCATRFPRMPGASYIKVIAPFSHSNLAPPSRPPASSNCSTIWSLLWLPLPAWPPIR